MAVLNIGGVANVTFWSAGDSGGDEIAAFESELLRDVGRLLDELDDATAAAGQVRALMFVARFRQDIGRRLEQLEEQQATR